MVLRVGGHDRTVSEKVASQIYVRKQGWEAATTTDSDAQHGREQSA
jgi:hypothetical protein